MLTKEQYRKAFLAGRAYRKKLEASKSQAQEQPNASPSIPLTRKRARKIVERAENKFASGKNT